MSKPETILSPRITKITGVPLLVTTSPSGIGYTYIAGGGLYMTHDGAYFEADVILDELGVWEFAWEGFISDERMTTSVEIAGIVPESVIS